MIYTVTFNPALDYVARVEHFAAGQVNRMVEEHIFYGGKGINVAAVLASLGQPVTALGFVAGFTGAEIERGVRAMGLTADFISVKKGLSRINVKLKSDQESEINGMGPEVTGEDVERLLNKLEALKEGDVLVLSGSIPVSVGDGIYERILSRLAGRGIRAVVDAEKELLLRVLPWHPFLIKPNHRELEDLFGVTVRTEEDVIAYANRLREMGAENVLVSMAGDGALLVNGRGEVFRQKAAVGTVKNSVGAGDSMVAGFLAGYLEKDDFAHALRLGAAAGGATAFSDGLGTREEILRLYEELGLEG